MIKLPLPERPETADDGIVPRAAGATFVATARKTIWQAVPYLPASTSVALPYA
ncbi:MAG: hypothetical protein KF778_19515 [Rhodocyclaceae bacterium]|nr:hypothetical protein [Rhodocyclaceae bacterium]MBX3670598.1 hypothetical protein [Rhodocyclaceae bacterium]